MTRRMLACAAVVGALLALDADGTPTKLPAKKRLPAIRDEAAHLTLKVTDRRVDADIATVVVEAYLSGDPTPPLSRIEDWWCLQVEWSQKIGRGIGARRVWTEGTAPGGACGADTITRSFIKVMELPVGHPSGDIEIRLRLRDRRGREIASAITAVVT